MSRIARHLIVATLCVVVGVGTLNVAYWQQFRVTSFDLALAHYDLKAKVGPHGTYRFSSVPDDEVRFKLMYMVTLERSGASIQHGSDISLKKRDRFTGGFDFIPRENVLSDQTMHFSDGNMVRFYWPTEPVTSKRTIIHAVATHFRNGRLVDTCLSDLTIELTDESLSVVDADSLTSVASKAR